MSTNVYSDFASAEQNIRLMSKNYANYVNSEFDGRTISSASRNDRSGKHLKPDVFWSSVLDMDNFSQLIHRDYQSVEMARSCTNEQKRKLDFLKKELIKHEKIHIPPVDQASPSLTPPASKKNKQTHSTPPAQGLTRLDRGRKSGHTKPMRLVSVNPHNRDPSTNRANTHVTEPISVFNGREFRLTKINSNNGQILISKEPFSCGVKVSIKALENTAGLPSALVTAYLSLNLGWDIQSSLVIKKATVSDWNDMVLLPIFCDRHHSYHY